MREPGSKRYRAAHDRGDANGHEQRRKPVVQEMCPRSLHARAQIVAHPCRPDIVAVHPMKEPVQIGQRWISDSEPELGLGSVERVSRLTLSLLFGGKRRDARVRTRQRADPTGPLPHGRHGEGSRRAGHSPSPPPRSAAVFFTTVGDGRELCETELSDAISFNKPEERLLVGQVDAPQTFALRLDALNHQHATTAIRGARFRGRTDRPHPAPALHRGRDLGDGSLPRVLLADEVGLGQDHRGRASSCTGSS